MNDVAMEHSAHDDSALGDAARDAVAERRGATGQPYVSVQIHAPRAPCFGTLAGSPMHEPETEPALFFELATRSVHTYVLEDLAEVVPRTHRYRGGLAPQLLRRAKSMLSARNQDSVTLVSLAEACGMSPAHFAREFKKSTGMPPHRWALKHKVSMAKDLLLHSGLPLADIATACGFVDHSHMSRWFKRMTGVNPKAWQRAHLDASCCCLTLRWPGPEPQTHAATHQD